MLRKTSRFERGGGFVTNLFWMAADILGGGEGPAEDEVLDCGGPEDQEGSDDEGEGPPPQDAVTLEVRPRDGEPFHNRRVLLTPWDPLRDTLVKKYLEVSGDVGPSSLRVFMGDVGSSSPPPQSGALSSQVPCFKGLAQPADPFG